MGGGGTHVEAPKPSQQELDLRQAQADLARQQQSIAQEQMRQQNMLTPLLMKNQGYNPIYGGVDPTAQARANEIDSRIAQLRGFFGNIPQNITQPGSSNQMLHLSARNGSVEGGGVQGIDDFNQPSMGQTIANPAYSPDAWNREIQQLTSERAGLAGVLDPNRITGWQLDPEVAAHQAFMKQLQNQQDQITQMMQERTMKALRGELPVDPALERELAQGRTTLQDTLHRNLGTGYETSTPGSMALSDYDKRAEELRQASRRAELNSTNALQLAGQQYSTQLGQMQLGNVLGITDLPSRVLGGLNGAGTAFGQAVNPYLQDRQFALQAGITNAQSDAAASQGLGSMFGSVVGAAGGIGAAALLASDRRLKRDITLVGNWSNGLPAYTYRYVWEPAGALHHGVMADDVRKVKPEAVQRIAGFDYVNYTLALQ